MTENLELLKCSTRAILLLGVSFGSITANPVYAQDTVEEAEETATTPPVNEGNMIIVTAQRREGTIQDTPFSIAAVSGDDLASAQINDPLRLSVITPGIQLSTVGNQLALFARGAGAPVANPRADPAAAYSVDGVAIARPLSVNGSYYDLSRVEVLKGPQGTLYGRNSTVGAVNVITNRPEFTPSARLGLEVGNYDLVRTEGMLNVPITDTLAARAAFQTIDRDGYLTNGYNDADNYAGRLKLLWEPSSTTSLLISGSYYRDEANGPGDVPVRSPNGSFKTEDPFITGNPWFVAEGPVNFLDQVPTNGRQDLESILVNAELETDLGFATLTVIPAYLETTYDARSYSAGFERRIDVKDEQTSVEVRLASPASQRLSWIIGGLYLNDEQSGAEDLGSRPGIFQRNQFDSLGLESFAVFGQLSYSVTDAFRLAGSVRYSNDKKNFDGFIQLLDLNQNPIPSPPAPPIVTSFGDDRFEDVSFRIGAEYDLSPDSLLYANVATGYKAGGFNNGAPPNTYDPENIIAYTIGSKNELLDGALTLNVEAWYWDYQDVQQVQFGFINPVPNFDLVTFNAAAQESYGVEVGATLRVGERGTLSADLTVLESSWKEFSLPGFTFGPFNLPPRDLSGQDTPFAPAISINLGYEHEFFLPSGATIVPSARTRIRSAQTLNTTGAPGSRVEGTMTSDLSISFVSPNKDFRVQAYLNNVEDEPVFSFAGVTPAGLWGTIGAPRTYGLRIVKEFQ